MSAKPQTLVELYRKAKEDAGDPKKLLEWLFMHAKAVGRQRAAEARLKRMESAEGLAQMRLTSACPPTLREQEQITNVMPAPQDLERATLEMAEAAEWVQACEHVMALLDSGRARPLSVIDGGKAAAK